MNGSPAVGSPSHAFFQSPRTHQPLRSFILAPDGHTYNVEDLLQRPQRGPHALNLVLKTASEEFAQNPDPEHWEAHAVESPVSLRPMLKPVQLSDQHVYDLDEARMLVRTWGVSPSSRQPLHDRERLVPNLAIQAMSAHYVRTHPDAVDEDTAVLLDSPLPKYKTEYVQMGLSARARSEGREPEPVLPVEHASTRPLLILAVSVGGMCAGIAAGILLGVSLSHGRNAPKSYDMFLVCVVAGALNGLGFGAAIGRLLIGRERSALSPV